MTTLPPEKEAENRLRALLADMMPFSSQPMLRPDLTTILATLSAERQAREAAEANLQRAFLSGWNAHETGLESANDGPAVGFRMFLRGHNFGDEEVGEDLTCRTALKTVQPKTGGQA